MTALLARAAVTALLALAILYPLEAPARLRRIGRVAAAAAGYCAATLAGVLLAVALGRTGGLPDYLAMSLIGSILIFCLTLVPFALAERVSSLFAPRRSLGWAMIAIALAGLWSFGMAAAYAPGGRMDALRILFDLALPALCAGLAWTLLLPRPAPASSIEEIFE